MEEGIMSRADKLFVEMCSDILENGYSTEGQKVRPHWEDGEAAYTIKQFGVVHRYDLQKEFPAVTLRPTPIKSASEEMLWIWQKKSNRISELGSHVWDEWADGNGTIGKAYGYQLGVKYKFKQGVMDQVDNVIWQLKNEPYSRRIMTNLFNFADLSEMALEPCAYSMTFNVTGNRLNGILNQRSQDILAANAWNVAQYSVLLMMMAQVTGFEPGELVHDHRSSSDGRSNPGSSSNRRPNAADKRAHPARKTGGSTIHHRIPEQVRYGRRRRAA